MSNESQHPKARPPMDRRTFLRRAAAAGIVMPSMAAVLAACGKGASNSVSTGPTTSGGAGANQYGTGGISGAAYPLARQDAPVTWNVDSSKLIADGMQPEKGVTLKILRWPYYLDDGVLKAFAKKYNAKYEVTEFSDMDKGLAKINSGQGDFDILFGMNVWAVGRSIAAGELRPINHSYIPNLQKNAWGMFQSPFYDVNANYSLPYSVWNTGIFWRNDKVNIDPHTMSNPYDVFWDDAPPNKTALLANAQDVLALPMFRDGLTDVNVTDPSVITKAQTDITQIAQKVGQLRYDHVDYTDLPSGKTWLHQSWSGNVSDAVVFLTDKSDADNLSYYWPGSDGFPANVDNDTVVLLNTGKAPVLAHLLANWLLDTKNGLDNFTNTTGYQMPLTNFTPEAMVGSGIVPKHLSSVIVTESDFAKGSRELELPPDADALWQQAFSSLQAGV
jgi:spermidine/putrescine transport system substrate-binding protein